MRYCPVRDVYKRQYQDNVEALRQALPKDLDASEIDLRLGATWIDQKYIQQFMYEILQTPGYLRGRIRVLQTDKPRIHPRKASQ